VYRCLWLVGEVGPLFENCFYIRGLLFTVCGGIAYSRLDRERDGRRWRPLSEAGFEAAIRH
jgi:hypothetical protein